MLLLMLMLIMMLAWRSWTVLFNWRIPILLSSGKREIKSP
jgi:hypothetical protein